ncbi:diguanylate cyclase [bacterium]|nr:diguanylate cyclase [bacterium]
MKKLYQLNLYIPFVIVIFIMSLSTVFTIAYIQDTSIHKSKKETPAIFANFFNKTVDNEAAYLKQCISFIQNRDDIAQKFQELNKDELNNSVKEIYKRLNKNINLTHMYFIKTDGTVLLRVHDYEKDSDTIERETFKKAQELQSVYYGLEFGMKKNYTLRVVQPWYVDGKLIGYLELGKEIDKVIDELSQHLNMHVYLAVNKKVYEDVPEFVKDDINQKTEIANYYIIYQTFDVPEQIESILNDKIIVNEIISGEHEYFVSKGRLSDVSGKELGYFIFLSDISLEHDIMYKSIEILVIILLLISSVLIIGGYIVIRKKEKSIYTLTSELGAQKEELFFFNIRLQKLYDLQKNMTILTDGKKLLLANKAIFDFFGFNDLEDFLKHHNCICDRFIHNDEFFHLGKVPEGKHWVETIIKLPDEQRIVAILDDNMESHAFNVSVNEFEPGNYIVSFADISHTVTEHVKLKRKISHDKLTNALNREFFDNNIALIIEERHPHKLGVVICDIDFFKNVNDTYGHNRGDVVLKQLVNIIHSAIRQEDYLIRWGGEEFIVLMKIDAVESLKKPLEHIRLQVEKAYFEEVTHITISLGATVYKEGEDISECIARADKALYLSKENGRNQVQIL